MTIPPTALKNLIKSLLPPDALRESKGTFSGSKEANTKAPDDPTNPINIWLNGDLSTRKIIVASGNVAGFVIIDKTGTAHVLSNTKTELDPNNDPVTIGHLGHSLHQIAPTGVHPNTLCSTIKGFLPSSLLASNGQIMDKTAAADRAHTVTATNANDEDVIHKINNIATYSDPAIKAHVSLIPICMPLPFGHDMEGPVNIIEDRQKLVNVHPFLGPWADAMAYTMQELGGLSLLDPSHGIDEHLLDELPANWNFSAPMYTEHWSLAISTDLAKMVFAENAKVSEANFDTWWPHNEQRFAAALAPFYEIQERTNPVPPPIVQGPPVPTSEPALSRGDRAAVTRVKTVTANWRLFLSANSIDEATGQATTVLPTLSPAFLKALDETTAANAVDSMRRSIEDHTDERAKTTHYMYRSAKFPVEVINVAFAAALQNFRLANGTKRGGDMFSTLLSIFNLLSPNEKAVEYVETVKENNVVTFEVSAQESDLKRTKATMGLYCAGLQTSYEHVRTALANVDCLLSWCIVEDKECVPDVVTIVKDLFDQISQSQMSQWYSEWKNSAAWIAHAMIQDVQTVLSAYVKFAQSDDNVAKLMDGKAIPSDALSLPKALAENLTSKISQTMHGQSLGQYASMPATYRAFVPESRKAQKQSSNSSPSNARANPATPSPPATGNRARTQTPTVNLPSLSDRGFITINGSNPSSQCVLSNGKSMCLSWCTVGQSCPHGRGCSFAHITYPNLGRNECDRGTINNWVNITNGVSWAPGFATPQVRFADTGTTPTPTRATSSGNNNNRYNSRRS